MARMAEAYGHSMLGDLGERIGRVVESILSPNRHLKGNEAHPFYPSLKESRSQMLAVARAKPVWKPGDRV